jgi:hypothetical protein
MSSRRYRTYKFFYDDDLGRTNIKRHRSYFNADGITEDTPTTALFRERVVNFDEKVTGTSKGLRHLLSYVGERALIAKIPYSPGDLNLIAHIEEILAQPQVICGDYVGEKLITSGSTNSF